MTNRFPEVTDYLATGHRPMKRAIDCDVYVLQPALEPLGIVWADERHSMVMIPKAVDDLLDGALVRVVLGMRKGSYVIAMKDRALAQRIFGHEPVRFDPLFINANMKMIGEWITANCVGSFDMQQIDDEETGASSVLVHFEDIAEHLLFKMRFEGLKDSAA